ncbi:hypothetical protein EES41_02280 [Streptomyces sp. ADI95-16]|uniref:hypothetical protein n=1 Tax=Streptomyces sp. ADI95-16 TaxID=1522758 RepID=UPI000F3A9FF4|nr:hypothetical protein [Streptomyces sp. ADI95-16]AYV25558.1 hypothetical protein EES41_02280 [Streptomyces sp. ADI95-16]
MTSEPQECAPDVFTVCGHWTNAPIVVGSVQSMSGAGYTHYTCPDHIYRYPPRAQWDELPAMRWTPRC